MRETRATTATILIYGSQAIANELAERLVHWDAGDVGLIAGGPAAAPPEQRVIAVFVRAARNQTSPTWNAELGKHVEEVVKGRVYWTVHLSERTLRPDREALPNR